MIDSEFSTRERRMDDVALDEAYIYPDDAGPSVADYHVLPEATPEMTNIQTDMQTDMQTDEGTD